MFELVKWVPCNDVWVWIESLPERRGVLMECGGEARKRLVSKP